MMSVFEALVTDIHRAYPSLPIQIDGGISVQTMPRLLEVGATQFAVGLSTISGRYPREFYDIAGVRTCTHMKCVTYTCSLVCFHISLYCSMMHVWEELLE